ncbi:DNA repair protein HhH-GPD [Spirochaetia bacterium]|nr:DNA repair protein HhH-GPD [Spirochaetia bacterium]
MKDVLTYKDHVGSVHFNSEDEVFYGKIEGIDDLIMFEGNSVGELKRAFQGSVEDYIQTCKKYNKDVEKSYKGSFNVRINPDLHKKVKRAAVRMGLSLNQFMQKAVEDELNHIEARV